MALATTTLSLTCAADPPVLDVAPGTAARGELPLAKRAARPLFAFWGEKYMRLDGSGFTTAVRGSGTSVQIGVAWKTYRGVKPIPPKIFVQSRTDGDCAKELISPERHRTYGGYRNPTESAAASLLWQNLTY